MSTELELPSKLLHGDCLGLLAAEPASSVDLIVTSPPYGDNRKKTYEGVPAKDYVAWFLPISDQLKRVLKDDGSFILNVKERVIAGERGSYILELILEMKRQGWRWTEEYIWHKKNSYPGKWPNRFRDAWERCLHFTKAPKFRMYQDAVLVPRGEWADTRLLNLNGRDFERHASNVGNRFGKRVANWVDREFVYPTNVLHLPTESSNRGHSAAFPVALPTWFISLFTMPGDIVLDPFMGSGTTGVAALRLKREFVGMEKNLRYFRVASEAVDKERQRQSEQGDPAQAPLLLS
jgi:site-specific DNA-methyltransferase (adenine-specific)